MNPPAAKLCSSRCVAKENNAIRKINGAEHVNQTQETINKTEFVWLKTTIVCENPVIKTKQQEIKPPIRKMKRLGFNEPASLTL